MSDRAPDSLPPVTAARSPGSADAIFRAFMIAGVVLFFVCALAFLAVREIVLPRINDYRPAIVAALSNAIGLEVSIDRIAADWQGLRPRMHLSGLVVADRGGTAALRLDRVDATIAWSSLLRAEAHFDSLVIFSPHLSLGREADGTLMVAGLPISSTGSGGGFAAWLMRQREIVIRDASLVWRDLKRSAPELRMESLNLRLSRVGGRYRFGMHGRPGEGIAEVVDVRGDLVGPASVDYGEWGGQIYVGLEGAELGALEPWIDYPLPVAGAGDIRLWADLTRGSLSGLLADVAMSGLAIRFDESLPFFEAFGVRGRLAGERKVDSYALMLRGVELTHLEAGRLDPLDLDLTLKDAESAGRATGQLGFNAIDVPVLAGLAPYVPLSDSVREALSDFAPRGRLEDVHVDWDRSGTNGDDWNLRASFTDIALRQRGALPGVEGVTGELEGNPRAGRFRLAGRDAAIDMPTIFPEPRLMLTSLQADGGWVKESDGRLAIMLDSARFENPDASGGVSGVYYPDVDGPGEIDLAARLLRADGEAVWRYLPWVVNEKTRNWLRSSLRGAKVSDANLTLKGRLEDFPFKDSGSGVFLVTVDFSGGRLDYAKAWPDIDSIDGSLRFEGAGMRVEAATARIFGVGLRDVVAEIPDLGAPSSRVMTIRGTAAGPTSDFLRFVSESPAGERIGRFAAGMNATGNGTLALVLNMPLRDVSSTEVEGEFVFSGNTLEVLDWLPPLTDASGRVTFSERSFSIPEARSRFLGDDLTVTANTSDAGAVRFAVKGGLALGALRQHSDVPLLEHLSGRTAWQSDIEVREGAASVVVRSTLSGVSSSLPYPLNKRSVDQWPFDLSLKFGPDGLQAVRGGLQGRLMAELVGVTRSEAFRVERGGVGVFAPLSLLDQGVKLAARLDRFDLDAWRQLLDSGNPGAGPQAMAGLWDVFAVVDVSAQGLRAFGQDFANFELGAMLDSEGWSGRIASEQMTGTFDWKGAGDGSLGLRLDRLELGRREVSDTEISKMMEIDPSHSLPDLDVIVERFDLRGMDLGRLELQARNRGPLWELDSVSLVTPEATLNGAGMWRAGANPRTDLSLHLETSDVGALLGRVGYPAAVRAGSASLEGGISWRGVPTRIHFPSLAGALELDARNGRFSQLDPGVGRLLGVLSLQSLPRRLKLDFSDVFSGGFAFDSVSGSMDLASGVIMTDDLMISGPSARIWLHGTANLLDETQDLKVVVQPTLSESVAVGAAAAVINPVAGVIAFLAQKVLSDPIERMFAFGYAITGSWADPQVEKLPVGPRTGQTRSGEQ